MTIADIKDPILRLIANRERLDLESEAACRGLGEDDDAINDLVDGAAQAIAGVDEQIADTVATTTDELVAQVAHLLNVVDRRAGHLAFSDEDTFHSEDWADRLVSTIATGIRRIGGDAI